MKAPKRWSDIIGPDLAQAAITKNALSDVLRRLQALDQQYADAEAELAQSERKVRLAQRERRP
jgi:hypothetical protein